MQANGQIVFSNGFAARVGVALAEDWYVEAVNWHGSFTFPPGTPFLEFLTATAREQESSQEVVVLCLEDELANLCGAATIEEERSPVSWSFQGSGSLIAAPKSGLGPTFSGPAYSQRMKKLKTRAPAQPEPSLRQSGIDTAAALEEQLAATQRQIIELKRDQLQLRQQAEKYHRLFQQSADAIFVCSPEGHLIDVNPAAVELSGYASQAQLLDLSVGDLSEQIEDARSFEQIMRRQGIVKDHPLTLKRSDGRRVETLVTAQALKDDSGRILAYEGTLRDVTEQKRLELRLSEAQKMEAVGVLAGGIAHDFNNLLMVIQGNAELGWSSLGEGEPQPELWQTILKAAQSGSRLVQQLISFSSKQSLELSVVSSVSLSQILFKALNRINGDGIELKLDLAADPGDLYVDQGTLEQIFLNIARNAREAMPQGGSLTVTAERVELSEELRQRYQEARRQPYIRISIADTGVGMDEETLSHIFEPFFTLKNAVSGLGLASAYGLVRQQGGFIDASSEPQRGSRFDIYLPRHDGGTHSAAGETNATGMA